MTRRNTELMLLCIAAPLVILLFAMVALNEGNRVTLDNLTVPLSMFATFVVAHLAIRKLAPGADPAILPLSFALSGIGIAFITRLAPDLAMKQVGWLFLGVVFMVLVLAFVKNLDKLGSYKYTIMIAGILLLMSPMLPVIGNEIYGSRIWLFIADAFSCGYEIVLCNILCGGSIHFGRLKRATPENRFSTLLMDDLIVVPQNVFAGIAVVVSAN